MPYETACCSRDRCIERHRQGNCKTICGVYTRFAQVEEQLFSYGNQNSPYTKFREHVINTLRLGASENRLILKPEQVAQAILKAATVDRPRRRYKVGLLAQILPRYNLTCY